MKYIDKQLGRLLFERLYENIINSKLTPKERIPKYRSILEDLFKALTNDSSSYLSSLNSRSIYVYREYKIPAVFTDRINNEYSHLSAVFERGAIPVEVPEMKSAADLIIQKIKETDEEQYNALLYSIGETT